ncbi:hypothetical protein U3516DRAFT_762109 [Neocallimastix sp. 'constans']
MIDSSGGPTRSENLHAEIDRLRTSIRNSRINRLTQNNQARTIQRAWRNVLERRRIERINNLTRRNKAIRIQRAWRNRIRNNIENALNERENQNEEQNPDICEEVQAIRNGELPVDEHGYISFGNEGNVPDETEDLNLDSDKNIRNRDIEPFMVYTDAYENIPYEHENGNVEIQHRLI